MFLPLALLFILAGCGGSAKAPSPEAGRVVHGSGFRFSIPPSWTVHRGNSSLTARGGGSPTAESSKAVVSATTFTLLKRYDPALFPETAAELDRNVAKLAAQAHGTVTDETTVTVAGRKVRAYRYAAGGFDTRIAFVLNGKLEVQLLCRAPAGSADPDGACGLLFRSFRLGAA